MSLINEALKRAREASVQPATTPAADPAMQPVLDRVPVRSIVSWTKPALSMAMLLLAVFFLGLWWRSPRQAMANSQLRAQSARTAPGNVLTVDAGTSTGTLKPLTQTALEPGPQSNSQVSADAKAAQADVRGLSLEKPRPPSVTGAGISTTATPPAPSAHSEPEPVPAAPPPEPHFRPAENWKLQGVFYRMSNASVLINGQTLFLGDEIDGAKVAAIERRSVHLVMGGRTNVLRLR